VSNDPVSRKNVLVVTALIQVEFDFTSGSLNFGRVSKDHTVTKSAFIEILDPDRTEITDIATSSPYIEAKRMKKPSAGHEGQVEIRVTILPGSPPGRINETVTVRSNLASKPEAELRVAGMVIGDVEVTPDALSFLYGESKGAEDQLPSRKLQIINRSTGATLKVLEVRDPQDRLELKLETIEDGQRYELTATLKKEALGARDAAPGSILITTDNPEQKRITVGYRLIKRK
jgi:hypothetical protein